MNKRHDTFFKSKNAEVDNKKGVVIEGYANYNAMDRVKERMDTKTARLDNFKKNPILLFNHCMDTPVGKVLELEPRDEGLYVKARVSGSNHAKVSYIRDLVLEGVLKAFSIRYDIEDYRDSFVDDPLNEGGTLIKDWELQELSIVTIPCQQDSLFSLSGAKSLGEVREMALNTKGARSAAIINKAIDAAVKEGADKGELLEKLAKQSGIEIGDVSAILAGEVTPIPDQFREACDTVLGCPSEEIANADAEDLEKSPEAIPEQEVKKSVEETEAVKAIEPAIHENPMIERLDSLVAIMGTVATKLDGLAQIMEGQAKPEKLEYKEEVEADEDKMSESEAEIVDETEKGSEDADEMMAAENAEDAYAEEKKEEEMEDAEKSSCGDDKKEEEDEEAMMEKGKQALIEKYGDRCKSLGINIEDYFKD